VLRWENDDDDDNNNNLLNLYINKHDNKRPTTW